MSLFKTNENYKNIIESIHNSDGLVSDEIQSELELTMDDRDDKSIAYRETISNLESENDQISLEIKRLQSLKKRNSNVIDTLNRSLLQSVLLHGKYKVGTVTFSSRKSQRVEVAKDIIDVLPDDYKVVSVTANKKAIKDALKAGDTINGCELIDCNSLMIK
jgi:uncharacterized coiled-coil DUF342 family protein